MINETLAYELNLMLTVTGDYIVMERVTTQDVYHAILETATFVNTADEPTPVNETRVVSIVFYVFDNSNQSSNATASVTLHPVNDPPELPNVTVSFNESTRTPVFLFTQETSIDDSDNNTLDWVIIELLSADFLDNLTVVSSDVVSFTTSGGDLAPTLACYPAENNETVQSITFSGPASKEDFNNAIRNITFNNPCPGLKREQRSVRVTLSDGVDKFTSWVYIDIEAVDDPPVCYFGQWPVSDTTLDRIILDYFC